MENEKRVVDVVVVEPKGSVCIRYEYATKELFEIVSNVVGWFSSGIKDTDYGELASCIMTDSIKRLFETKIATSFDEEPEVRLSINCKERMVSVFAGGAVQRLAFAMIKRNASTYLFRVVTKMLPAWKELDNA